MSGEARVCAVGDIDESAGMDIPEAPPAAPAPADDTIVSVASARGELRLSVSRDLPVLRQWLIDNVVTRGEVVQPDNLVSITLPVAGLTEFYPNQIRTLATALANAMALEEQARPTVPVASVDGVDYPRQPAEPTTEYEQRVINDMMLRRARELVRDHGLSAAQASSMVHEMVERQRYQDLVSINTGDRAPTAQEAREFVSMEAEGQRLAVGSGDSSPISDDTREALRAHVDNGGVISFADGVGHGNVAVSDGAGNMANMPIRQWTAEMLTKAIDREPEPTLREMWAD